MLSGNFWNRYIWRNVVHPNVEHEMAERDREISKAHKESRRLFHFFCEGWDAASRQRFPGPSYLAKADERREYERGFYARKGSDDSR